MIDIKQASVPESSIDLGECIYLADDDVILTIDGKQYVKSGNLLSNAANDYPVAFGMYGKYMSNVSQASNWTSTLLSGLIMISVSSANGLIFLCVYDNSTSKYILMTSTNGINFTTITFPLSSTTYAVRTVTYSHGAYVACGGMGSWGQVTWSTNLTTWSSIYNTTASGPIVGAIGDVNFGGATNYLWFVAAGVNGSVGPAIYAYSQLNISNQIAISSSANNANTTTFYDLTFDPTNRKVYIGSYLGGTVDVLVYTNAVANGNNTTEVTGMSSGGATVHSISYNSTYKVLVATFGEKVAVKNIATNTWTVRTPSGMTATSGSRVAVSDDGTMVYATLQGEYAYSLNGGTSAFIKGPSLPQTGFQNITYGNKRFVIVGSTGVLTSADLSVIGLQTKLSDTTGSTIYMRIK